MWSHARNATKIVVLLPEASYSLEDYQVLTGCYAKAWALKSVVNCILGGIISFD